MLLAVTQERRFVEGGAVQQRRQLNARARGTQEGAMLLQLTVVLMILLGSDVEVETDFAQEVDFQHVQLIRIDPSHIGIERICIIHIIKVFRSKHESN